MNGATWPPGTSRPGPAGWPAPRGRSGPARETGAGSWRRALRPEGRPWEVGGTALEGRIFTSLGFQTQAGGRQANPGRKPTRSPPRLGLKPQAAQYPPLQGGPTPDQELEAGFGRSPRISTRPLKKAPSAMT